MNGFITTQTCIGRNAERKYDYQELYLIVRLFLICIDKIRFIGYNVNDESYPLAFVSVADTLGARSQERGVSETLWFTAT